MEISKTGLNLIKHFEGCKLTAYQDAVNVWTIGYGHTGKDVKAGQKITADQAETLLKADVAKFELAVTGAVKVPLTQGQFDALVSFVFNLGMGTLLKSTLLKRLNKRDYQGAAGQFILFVHAGGRELPGLIARREAERDLFLKTQA